MQKLIVFGMAVLLAAGSVQAAPQFFIDIDQLPGNTELTPLPAWPNADAARAAFELAVPIDGTQSFEAPDFVDGMSLNGQVVSFGTVNATFTGAISAKTIAPGSTNGLGRYPTDGVNYLESTTAQFQIEFAQYRGGFGFYGVDLGDFNGRATVALYRDGSLVASKQVPSIVPTDFGSVLFFGVKAGPFNKVVITNSKPGGVGVGDGFGFDEMLVGEVVAVPAPGAILLGSIGTCLVS